MSEREKFAIIQWLYINDGKFKSKNEWREGFLDLLESLTVYKK